MSGDVDPKDNCGELGRFVRNESSGPERSEEARGVRGVRIGERRCVGVETLGERSWLGNSGELEESSGSEILVNP